MSQFRPEIAGLRAIAVAVVVLFHLKVAAFDGGFVGVDVFFVISGYLITRNILADLRQGSFSIGRFYARRARRIFPALIATVVVTYLIGALWCAPLMFLDVAKECTHALLSIANIQYWRESHQYFAPSSDELALLHVWSLSLEEQFYLAWPLLLVLAHRYDRVRPFILVAGLASLAGAVIVARFDVSAAFFLTPFRIYEFGCGALVLFVERIPIGRLARNVISALGVLAIVVSALLFRSDLPWLEAAMLLPCLGASAVILAGSGTRAAAILSLPPVTYLGAISYSLYLCHWPLIFFARFIFGDAAESVTGTIVLSVTMVLVASAMYVLVERPFLRSSANSMPSFRRTALQFWSVILVLVGVTHYTFVSRGLTWRVPQQQHGLARMQDFPTGQDMVPMTGPIMVTLVGDSHAAQYDVGLSVLMTRLGGSMEILGGPGCPILYGVSLRSHARRKDCIAIRDNTLARMQQITVPIVFNQFWSFYDDATIEWEAWDSSEPAPTTKGTYHKLERALDATIGRLLANGRRVMLIGAQVEAGCAFNRARLYQGPLPHAPLKPCPAGSRAVAEAAGARMNALLAAVQGRWRDHVQLLKPVDHLCGPTECPTMQDGLWLYFDKTHFSVAGSRAAIERMAAPLTRFIEQGPLQN